MANIGLNRQGVPWDIDGEVGEDGLVGGEALNRHLCIGRDCKALQDRYEFLMDNFENGDCVFVSSLTVLSQSYATLTALLKLCEKIGVKVVSINEGYDSRLDTENVKRWLNILSKFDKARRENEIPPVDKFYSSQKRYPERTIVDWSLYPNFNELYEKLNNKGITKVEFARKMGISRPTLDKLINRKRDEEENAKRAEKSGDEGGYSKEDS